MGGRGSGFAFLRTIPLGAYAIAWSTGAVALLSVYVKYFLLFSNVHGLGEREPGVAVLLRTYGLDPHLTAAQYLSFFRADLLLACVSYLLLVLAGRRRGTTMSILRTVWVFASLGLFAVFLIEFAGYRVVKHFVTLNLLLDGLEWGLSHPEGLAAYLRIPSIPWAVAALIASGIAVWAIVRIGPAEIGRRLERILFPAFVATWALAVPVFLLTAAAWVSPFPSTHYHLSALELAWTGFWPRRSAETPTRRSPDLVRDAFRRETASPPFGYTPRFGAAKSFDVLFFIFETGPSRFVQFDEALPDFPATASLRGHSWVATRHYTTYPATSAAVFSIFHSLYPPQFLTWFKEADRKIPGLIRAFGKEGYDILAFVPSRESEQLFGGAPQRMPPQNTVPDRSGSEDRWSRRRRLDEASLEQLKSFITEHARADRRYWAVYLPQIGHYPWGPLPAETPMAAAAKGRRLMAIQDRWLGELVQVLAREGRLDRTLIVVTSDHGVRSRLEDPEGFTGFADAASFQVPFLLYAGSGVLPTPQQISWVTSHIDVGPSILDLLGVTANREWEQGTPIWDPRLAGRRTFLCGKEMLGADTFHDLDGRYLMYSYIANAVFVSDRLSFGIGNVVPNASRDARYARERLQAFDDSEREWLRMAIR